MKKKAITFVVIAVVVIGILILWGVSQGKKAHAYDELANCIAESGAKFYGAFWCPHCANQKKMFSASAKLLPYVECSTPDGQSQTPECDALGITSYPTWILADGTILHGEQEPSVLAEKTMCELPPNS